jgi:putative YphP/YqiW family bacilliredoxin
MYPAEVVAPMKEDLSSAGFQELTTPADVDQAIAQPGATLVVLNSVCGCAAANMRPGVKLSLENAKLPASLTTAFAGVDKDAVDRARKFMLPYPPSSPCIALFVDGKLAHMIERHHIEGRTAQMVSDNLKGAYDAHC